MPQDRDGNNGKGTGTLKVRHFSEVSDSRWNLPAAAKFTITIMFGALLRTGRGDAPVNSMKRRSLVAAAVMAALGFSGNALATNGMNMEAYGARAGGMGGAAMAYDSGNSAVMNNPATLSLIPNGADRVGVGLTVLGPDVTSRFGNTISSDSDTCVRGAPSVTELRCSLRAAWEPSTGRPMIPRICSSAA